MARTPPENRAGIAGADCPCDAFLSELLEEQLPEQDQSSLIGHLDCCIECRTRLDELAGGHEFCLKIGRNLREDLSDVRKESPTWMALLQTRVFLADDTQAPYDDEPSLDFLAPCEKAGLLGRLGRYEVLEVLGRGGMGLVLKAYDPSLDRLVAIKVLASPLALGPQARSRFRREARTAAAVCSEHTVTIHAVEESAEYPYVVMEFVPGGSLQERIERGGPLGVDEIVRIGLQVARGLAAAHAQGLIHRDIKPANILLGEHTGTVKITDFGLARAVDDAGLTCTGTVAGTPQYMAPEQAEGLPADHRADLFSLGSLLYTICTGRPPFRGEETLAVLRSIREDLPTPIRQQRPEVPDWLVQIIEKLHCKDPAERYASAAEVAEELQQQASEFDPSSPTPRMRRGGVGWRGFFGWIGLARPSASGSSRAKRSRVKNRRSVGRWLVASVALLVAGLGIAELIGWPGWASFVARQLGAGAAPLQEVEGTAGSIQPESPRLIRRFQGHTGPVACVAFSPDGKHILSGSGWPGGDRTLRLWDVETGREIRRFHTSPLPPVPGVCGPREVPGEILSLAFSPDGCQALSGAAGGFTQLWNVETGEPIGRLPGHRGSVYGVAFSPDGERALSGGRDGVARLWELKSGRELLRLEGHNVWIRSVAISPDGQRALTGSYDGTMRLWDLDTGRELRQFRQPDGRWVWCVAFLPDGHQALAVSGNVIRLWDLESGEEIRRFEGHISGITSVALSTDARRVLSAGYDSSVRLWDVKTGRELECFSGHRNWIWSVAFCPDGRFGVSAGGGLGVDEKTYSQGSDFAIRLWNLEIDVP